VPGETRSYGIQRQTPGKARARIPAALTFPIRGGRRRHALGSWQAASLSSRPEAPASGSRLAPRLPTQRPSRGAPSPAQSAAPRRRSSAPARPLALGHDSREDLRSGGSEDEPAASASSFIFLSIARFTPAKRPDNSSNQRLMVPLVQWFQPLCSSVSARLTIIPCPPIPSPNRAPSTNPVRLLLSLAPPSPEQDHSQKIALEAWRGALLLSPPSITRRNRHRPQGHPSPHRQVRCK
jgi:hypothetical protein